MGKGTTILSLAQQARETFDRNIDTMIAAFLIRHPEVDPGDIELVFTPSMDGKMHFRINSCPKGVLLPEQRRVENTMLQEMEKILAEKFADGWNACIDEVKRLNERTPEQLRAPLPGIEDACIVEA